MNRTHNTLNASSADGYDTQSQMWYCGYDTKHIYIYIYIYIYIVCYVYLKSSISVIEHM